jgi:hypothetical protein
MGLAYRRRSVIKLPPIAEFKFARQPSQVVAISIATRGNTQFGELVTDYLLEADLRFFVLASDDTATLSWIALDGARTAVAAGDPATAWRGRRGYQGNSCPW